MIIKELLVGLGIKVDQSSVTKATATIDVLTSAAKKLAGVLSFGLVFYKLKQLSESIRETGDLIEKQSQRMGVSFEVFQEFAYVAGLTNVSLEELAQNFSRLSFKIAEASRGKAEYVQMFKDLGIEVRYANGEFKEADVLFGEIADTLNSYTNEFLKAGAANRLFSETGSKLLPMLNTGSAGIMAMREEARKFGLMNNNLVKQSVELTDEYSRFNYALKNLSYEVGLFLIPNLIKIIKVAVLIIREFTNLARGTHILESAFYVLAIAAGVAGIAMLISFAPIISLVALIAVGLAAIIIIVDDIWTGIEGGKSILFDLYKDLKAFIDDLFVHKKDDPWFVTMLRDSLIIIKNIYDYYSKIVQSGFAFLLDTAAKAIVQMEENESNNRNPFDVGTYINKAAAKVEQAKIISRLNFLTSPAQKNANTNNINTNIAEGAIVINGAGDAKSVGDEVVKKIDERIGFAASQVLTNLVPRAAQ